MPGPLIGNVASQRVFNVKDYGAIANGSTDDSSAFNLAFAAAYDAGGGTVYVPNGRYAIKGTYGSANSILKIKCSIAALYPFEPIEIRLIGESKGTLNSTFNGYGGGCLLDATGASVGSGTLPAILADTAFIEPAFNTTGCNFCDVQVFIDKISILAPANSSFGGIRLANCTSAEIGDEVGLHCAWSVSGIKPFTNWGTTGPVQPTADSASIGIYLPRPINYRRSIVGAAAISGWSTGIAASEHAHFRKTLITYCDQGVYLFGYATSSTIGHLLSGFLTIENCIRPLSAGSGDVTVDLIINLETGTTAASTSAWWVRINDLVTANSSKIKGIIRFLNSEAGTGTYLSLLQSSSNPGLTIINLADGSVRMSQIVFTGTGAVVVITPTNSADTYFAIQNNSGANRVTFGWVAGSDIGFLGNLAAPFVTWTQVTNPVIAWSSTATMTFAGAINVAGGAIMGAAMRLKSYIVSSLPSATAGDNAFVTDANTSLILGLGLTVTGGGANKVPVYYDGTNWIIG